MPLISHTELIFLKNIIGPLRPTPTLLIYGSGMKGIHSVSILPVVSR